jgi:hypothetical protein
VPRYTTPFLNKNGRACGRFAFPVQRYAGVADGSA